MEDVTTDCKTHKVVVKGEKADPLKVLDRVTKKTHRHVELLSPIPKPPAEEPKKPEEKEPPKPEEKKEEVLLIFIYLLIFPLFMILVRIFLNFLSSVSITFVKFHNTAFVLLFLQLDLIFYF